jgi:hypothetical protein
MLIMACSSCSPTTAGQTRASDFDGSLLAGAAQTFIYSRTTSDIYSVRAPNIITFNDNPFLKVGDTFLLQNREVANNAGINPIAECQTVTTAPALVAGRYEVATNDTFVSLTGTPTVIFAGTTAGNAFTSALGCGVGAAATKKFSAVICDGVANASNFSGYLYNKTPNSSANQVLVIITSGSPEVILKSRTSTSISKGDKIEIAQTALVGAASATVINVINGRNASNEKVTQLVLNVPVTGITAAAVGGEICTSATATPQSITPIVATVSCGCAVTLTIPAAVTSSANFPRGQSIDSDCDNRTMYYYTLKDTTPGSERPFITGKAYL